ncbi:hypothetical protein DY000_02036458 [Brassica cretica]|uniref:Uncharacterized protein n=1 Tax=Brassica cretica TaxID=69181 RepID=A0ABQ7BCU9_BRACR|nr:hypothetical protein DY000_02036458 [Brassica cretica]
MALENQSAATRFTGKVNWFNDSKGFGFITPDDGTTEELFVHQSSIVSEGYRSLAVDDLVEFEIAQGTDGKTKAVEVTAPGGAPLKKKEASSRGRSGRGGSCYNCGDAGHLAKDCRDGGERGACYTCGDTGHLARDCVQKPSGERGGGCYTCGDAGHLARDCVKKSGGERVGGGACYTCGGSGHMARECPSKRQTGGGGCYECGGAGHLARDCDKRGGGGGGGGRSSGGCYECGGAGHMALYCFLCTG